MVNGKQRIYAAYTRDFHDFTDFHPFIERKEHIIDTTIAGENGRIYRFSAEEFCGGITMEVGSGLHAADYHYIYQGHLPGLKGMEGPVIFIEKRKGSGACVQTILVTAQVMFLFFPGNFLLEILPRFRLIHLIWENVGKGMVLFFRFQKQNMRNLLIFMEYGGNKESPGVV